MNQHKKILTFSPTDKEEVRKILKHKGVEYLDGITVFGVYYFIEIAYADFLDVWFEFRHLDHSITSLDRSIF